jgi:hypothetical protein
VKFKGRAVATGRKSGEDDSDRGAGGGKGYPPLGQQSPGQHLNFAAPYQKYNIIFLACQAAMRPALKKNRSFGRLSVACSVLLLTERKWRKNGLFVVRFCAIGLSSTGICRRRNIYFFCGVFNVICGDRNIFRSLQRAVEMSQLCHKLTVLPVNYSAIRGISVRNLNSDAFGPLAN